MRRTDSRRGVAIVGVLLLIGIVLTMTGCVWAEGEPVSVEEAAEEESSDGGLLGPILPKGRDGGEPEILMMGRSVMYDWFDYDGWDGRNALNRDGKWFYYAELETPPTIGDSADGYIAEVPDETILFFKLCFDDFWATEEYDVEDCVAENVGYVEQVVATADARGMTLILGNALPKVRSQTTPALVDTHIAYNKELERIAAENPNVWVFDQWDILADKQDGSLTKGFAVTADDSHLSSIAYEEMTPALMELVDEIAAE